jgi:hypothetical protein
MGTGQESLPSRPRGDKQLGGLLWEKGHQEEGRVQSLNMRMYADVPARAHTHTYAHTHKYTMHARMYVHNRTHTCTYATQAHIYAHVHTHIHKQTRTYTHARTRTHAHACAYACRCSAWGQKALAQARIVFLNYVCPPHIIALGFIYWGFSNLRMVTVPYGRLFSDHLAHDVDEEIG